MPTATDQRLTIRTRAADRRKRRCERCGDRRWTLWDWVLEILDVAIEIVFFWR
jgi:hypothetical protein